MIPRGYGTLLAHYAKSVDVRLNTPVSRIRWGGARRHGGHRTRAPSPARVAVVALPSADRSRKARSIFSPHLPVEVLQAHHDLPLGILDKIALRFKKNVFPSETTEFLQLRRDDGRSLDYLTRHWDSNVCIAFAPGRLARELEGAGRGRGDRARARRARDDAGRRRPQAVRSRRRDRLGRGSVCARRLFALRAGPLRRARAS